jgi:hypothetical protein
MEGVGGVVWLGVVEGVDVTVGDTDGVVAAGVVVAGVVVAGVVVDGVVPAGVVGVAVVPPEEQAVTANKAAINRVTDNHLTGDAVLFM